MSYNISVENMAVLDAILPYFRYDKIFSVAAGVQKAYARDSKKIKELATTKYIQEIGEFLFRYGFASGSWGDPVITKKGVELKDAGSLKNYIATEQKDLQERIAPTIINTGAIGIIGDNNHLRDFKSEIKEEIQKPNTKQAKPNFISSTWFWVKAIAILLGATEAIITIKPHIINYFKSK